jgi:hypothetical protein
MKQSLSGEACSWAEIKERLDPAWSYAVIETEATTPGAGVFRSIANLLSRYSVAVRSQEICREAKSGKLLLLMQLDPDKAAAVKDVLLDPRLPPSVTVYFYNHSPVGSEQGRRPDDAQ